MKVSPDRKPRNGCEPGPGRSVEKLKVCRCSFVPPGCAILSVLTHQDMNHVWAIDLVLGWDCNRVSGGIDNQTIAGGYKIRGRRRFIGTREDVVLLIDNDCRITLGLVLVASCDNQNHQQQCMVEFHGAKWPNMESHRRACGVACAGEKGWILCCGQPLDLRPLAVIRRRLPVR